jgi:hypothetical protein
MFFAAHGIENGFDKTQLSAVEITLCAENP